jgi:hypothetical protein
MTMLLVSLSKIVVDEIVFKLGKKQHSSQVSLRQYIMYVNCDMVDKNRNVLIFKN